MDLLDYFSQSQFSSLSINDKTYDKIISHLNAFIESLPEKDKQVLLQVTNKSYLKYRGSITKEDDGNSIYELIIKLFMAMRISEKLEQNKDS